MQVPAVRPRVIRFGVFEADLQEAELRKSGIRIKLQDQPFQILTMLLERPGQTVTREELQRQLWSADTFVDFDHSLNSSIKKLREALGDDSENPRFIETLHRRGYRFIAPVEGPNPARVEATKQIPPEPGPLAAMARAAPKKLANWKNWTALTALVLGAALLGLWLRPQLPPPRITGSQELTNDGVPKHGLVTDGNRIYFTEYVHGRDMIAQVSTRGGETSIFDSPILNPDVKGISADQSELLLRDMDGFYWSFSVPAGTAHRLGDVTGEAAWMPNGMLAFANGRDLYVAQHDGSHPRKFTTVPGSVVDLSFAPDGARFRATIFDDVHGTSTIWEARADGSDMHPVFPGWSTPPSECCGYWTRDAKYYVFQSSRQGTTNLWMSREHSATWPRVSHEPVQLTVGPLELSNAVPSVDGKKLFAIGHHPRSELVAYDSKPSEFVPFFGGISAGELDFSRDARWVTYVTYPDRRLWRSKLDGSERLQLTNPPLKALLPRWSPNNQQIAFSGRVEGKPWKIFLISKDGGTAQPISNDDLHELDPTWSADGKTLAFGRSSFGNDDSSRIGLFDIKNHDITDLPGSGKICCPRWSPDGRSIVAVTSAPHQDRLKLYDTRNKKWRELHTDTAPFSFGYLAWSQDSAYIYFDMNASGDSRYFRLRIEGEKLERPVDMKALRQFPDFFLATPFESWTGLGPGDTPLFVRDVSTQEIYALDLDLP